MFGVMQHLDVAICADAEEATRKGYSYSPLDYKPVTVLKCVVVLRGTEGGSSTVDLVLADEQGQKYVVMLTGALLKSIPC